MRVRHLRSCGIICACVLALATCATTAQTIWLLLSTFHLSFPGEILVNNFKHIEGKDTYLQVMHPNLDFSMNLAGPFREVNDISPSLLGTRCV